MANGEVVPGAYFTRANVWRSLYFVTLAFFFILFGVSLFSTGHTILYHYIYSIVFGLTHHDGRHRDARLDGNMLHLRPVCQAIGSVIFNEGGPKQNEKDEREKNTR